MHAAGEVDNAVVETVERLLRAPSQMGLYTRAQSLEYLGSMFRGTLDVPSRFTDLQVGQNWHACWTTIAGCLPCCHCPEAAWER